MIPHSPEAEHAVLGRILSNPPSLDDVLAIVQPEDFFLPDHVAIFRHMLEMTSAGRPMDAITLADELRERKSLAMDGEVLSYLGELVRNAHSSINIASYATIVADRATQRRLLSATMKAQEIIHEGGDTREMLDKVQSLVVGIEHGKDGEGPTALADILPGCLQGVSDKEKGGSTGLLTGFVDLDRKTAGLHPGQLVVLAGRPSMGKTALAMNLCSHVAQTGAVLVFSLETTREALANRMIAGSAKVPLQKIRTGNLTPENWDEVNTATRQLTTLPLTIDETSGLSVLEMRARARKVGRKSPLVMVMVDYLQLASGRGENRTQEVSDISRQLKAMAKELRCPVLALSQLNRGLESRPNKRPVMSDLRESGSIEQDADLILFLYRDEVYNENSPHKGLAELKIGKQKDGEQGVVWLNFLPDLLTFRSAVAPETIRNVQPFAGYRRGMN